MWVIVTDGSELLQVQVSGNQDLLGSPVLFSLSWLQSVSWEVLSEGCSSPAQVVVCLQGVDTISRLSAFLFGWNSELRVWDFFLWASFYTFSFPLITDSHLTFGFWVQCFCWSLMSIESAGGCGFYSHLHLSDTKRPVCFDPVVVCAELCESPGSVFWGNVTLCQGSGFGLVISSSLLMFHVFLSLTFPAFSQFSCVSCVNLSLVLFPNISPVFPVFLMFPVLLY